jgi:serine/threonine-protein kinase
MNRDDVQLPDGVRAGEVLAGKYRIGAIISAGTMAVVVTAHHILLRQKVAIKFLVADQWEQPDAVGRFVQEAQAAVRIQSEHVVRVLDVAVLDGGVPYIVMEYLEGSDLATRLRTLGPLPVREAVDYLLEACEAIAEAHRIGIIHRDIKPANLFLLERPDAPTSIKVLDFGISKNNALVCTTLDCDGNAPSVQATRREMILGSPYYMSPEQMESAGDVDARSDIWSLGVSLFEMITGSHPFTGGSLLQVYSKTRSPSAGAWRDRLVNCPEGIEAALARCLVADRDKRYARVSDFAKAIAHFGTARARASLQRIPGTPVEFLRSETFVDGAATLRSLDSLPQGIEKVSSRAAAGGGIRALGTYPVLGTVVIGVLANALLIFGGLAHQRDSESRKSGAQVAMAAAHESTLARAPSPSSFADWRHESQAFLRSVQGSATANASARRTGPTLADSQSPAVSPHVPIGPPAAAAAAESHSSTENSASQDTSSRFDAEKIREMLKRRE